MASFGDILGDVTGIPEQAIGFFTGAPGAEAAQRAAELQAGAFGTGIEEQRRQFDITQEQLAPFREAGVSALGQQQALLGLGTPEEQEAALAAFAETPGQRFLRQQQERALLRNASAIGGLGGGNIKTDLQGQASGRAQTDLANRFSRLGAISGTGQQAATQVGQFGQQTAGNIANLQASQGAARASGILGAQQARTQGIQNIISTGSAIFGAGGF